MTAQQAEKKQGKEDGFAPSAIEQKGSKKKYRRLSSEEDGNQVTPNFRDVHAKIHLNLKANFPIHAERQLRVSKGKHRYTPIDIQDSKNGKKRQDYFILKYIDQCSFPAVDSEKDTDGEWLDRCEFMPPKTNEDVCDAHKAAYKNSKNRKGIFERISLRQFSVLWHCREHYLWWAEENGEWFEFKGKQYQRPPSKFKVFAPNWEEE